MPAESNARNAGWDNPTGSDDWLDSVAFMHMAHDNPDKNIVPTNHCTRSTAPWLWTETRPATLPTLPPGFRHFASGFPRI
jgi:hypothetical protein